MNDQKSVTGSCERPYKQAWVARQCKESSTSCSTAALSALLAEREDYPNRCEALEIENQCLPGLALEAKKIRKKLAKPEKADTASKTTAKGRNKSVTAVDKHMGTLETELTSANAPHSLLAKVLWR